MTRYLGTATGWVSLADGLVGVGAPGQAPAPTNINPPSVSLARVGEPLVVKYGTWSGGSGFTTRVLLAGAQVAETYVPLAGDVGESVVFEVTRLNPDGPSTTVTSAAVTVEAAATTPVGEKLYAVQIPGRVIVGMAGGANRPSWAEGRDIIQDWAETHAPYNARGVGSYEWRRFTSTGASGSAANANELRSMLADADDAGVLAWVSFKVINNDWAGVAAGDYPALPQMFRTVAQERAAAGKRPFMAAMHHEPRGDGSLAVWAQMQEYMSDQLADVTDILTWSCIGNGFLWNTVAGTQLQASERGEMFPQSLIDTFRANKHCVAVDTYDDHPVYAGQETYPVGGQSNRTSVKLQNWIDWMRARNCGGLGIGEWSTTDVGEMPRVAAAFWRNRDILGVTNYFNSVAGASSWDWRAVPANYPIYHPSNPADYGGTALTQGRLQYFPQILLDSVDPANTGPL